MSGKEYKELAKAISGVSVDSHSLNIDLLDRMAGKIQKAAQDAVLNGSGFLKVTVNDDGKIIIENVNSKEVI